MNHRGIPCGLQMAAGAGSLGLRLPTHKCNKANDMAHRSNARIAVRAAQVPNIFDLSLSGQLIPAIFFAHLSVSHSAS
jgi:hypothetical protein